MYSDCELWLPNPLRDCKTDDLVYCVLRVDVMVAARVYVLMDDVVGELEEVR